MNAHQPDESDRGPSPTLGQGPQVGLSEGRGVARLQPQSSIEKHGSIDETEPRSDAGSQAPPRSGSDNDDDQGSNERTREDDGQREQDQPASKHQPVHRYLPILSGLLVPFSVLLDIPGLTERWYIRTDGFNVVETRPNPAILDVGQAVSMAFGVIANIALVMRFLEKWPYESTWVAIGALTFHGKSKSCCPTIHADQIYRTDILQIVIVLTFGIIHSVDDGFTFGTAFWMTVASTVASLVVNVTLIIDFVRTPNFRRSGSGLTEKQRSLVVAVMALLVYIGLGSLVNTFLIRPQLSYIDSMYFTITTIETVGFGDITPNTLSSRIWAFFYDTVGIVMLAFCVAIARESIIETFEASYRARRDAIAQKARERKEEKRRRLKDRREKRERELRDKLASEGVEDIEAEVQALKDSGAMDARMPSARGGKIGLAPPVPATNATTATTTGTSGTAQACSSVTIMAAASKVGRAQRELDYYQDQRDGFGRVRSLWRLLLRKAGLMKSFTPPPPPPDESEENDGTGEDMNDGPGSKLVRSSTMRSSMSGEEQFKTFKKQMEEEQKQEFRIKLSIALTLFFAFWLVGAAVFHATEGWTYFEALYFCYIFFSTIGYGDYSPKSAAGRAFFIAWSLLSVSVMTLLLSVVTETWSSRYRSTISEGRTRRTLRRLGGNGSTKSTEDAISRLLATEGYAATAADEDVDVKDLPQRLSDAVKGFHEHARFFMLGRTGDPPERYKSLIDAASELESEFATLADNSEMGGGGGGGALGSDARHFLFLVSYERQFDALNDAADRVGKVFDRPERELDELRMANAELRDALDRCRRGDKDEDEDGEAGDGRDARSSGERCQTCRGLLPFVKRPPGGFGDEETEQDLETEIDRDDDGGDADGETSAGSAQKHIECSETRRCKFA